MTPTGQAGPRASCDPSPSSLAQTGPKTGAQSWPSHSRTPAVGSRPWPLGTRPCLDAWAVPCSGVCVQPLQPPAGPLRARAGAGAGAADAGRTAPLQPLSRGPSPAAGQAAGRARVLGQGSRCPDTHCEGAPSWWRAGPPRGEAWGARPAFHSRCPPPRVVRAVTAPSLIA